MIIWSDLQFLHIYLSLNFIISWALENNGLLVIPRLEFYLPRPNKSFDAAFTQFTQAGLILLTIDLEG